MESIIETLKSADNEATSSPYWLILDPRQNMSCDLYNLASQISGPFFCREDAKRYMENRPHHYSKNARVFCHSGHFSRKYEELCRKVGI
jgi:predicted metalloprotease